MEAMPVGCYKQMSAMKEGVIMRLQCNYIYFGNLFNIFCYLCVFIFIISHFESSQ